MERRCTSCNELKPINDFGTGKNYADGVKRVCRKCDTSKWSQRLQEHRLEALKAIGNLECNHCKITDVRVLIIDHLDGGGNQERKNIGGGVQYYKWVKNNAHKYQILCHNCNYLKRINNHEHGKGAKRTKKIVIIDDSIRVVSI